MATTAPRAFVSDTKRTKPRPLAWSIHHWAGLKLSLFMAFILATGTLATVANEMDWLARPAMRVAPQEGPKASWGTLAEAARAAAPQARLQTLYAPIDPWFAAQARFERSDGTRFWVYVNPWTAKVQGTGEWASFQRFFRQTHRHLMLPTKWGVPIVSSLALVLLTSLVTGLLTYKRFWRGLFRTPRTRDARTLTGDLHRLCGLWTLPFVLLISLTGFWYLVESLGGEAPRLPEPSLEAEAPPVPGKLIDAMVAAAQAAQPDLQVQEIRLPSDKEAEVAVMGQASALLVRDRANAVWFDARNGRLLLSARGEALNTHQRLSEMADPLHFGTFGGLATKLLWLLFGLLLTGLAVTGALITSLRLAPSSQASEAPLSLTAWRAMGAWRYVGVAAILIALALAPFSLSGTG